MRLTISHNSALSLLRAARIQAGKEGLSLVSTDIICPALDQGLSWTPLLVSQVKQGLNLPEHLPLDVLVNRPEARVRARGIRSRVWGTTGRGLWFMSLGYTGIAIPKPEILLAQMAESLSLAELVALGHELCGCYTLRPTGVAGSALTQIPPVTSEVRIREVLKQTRRLRGSVALQRALPYLHNDSVSPQETVLSVIAQLPVERYGYQVAPLDLNVTITPMENQKRLVKARARTPDILFRGTMVGLNYDGDVHSNLGPVVRAAKAVGREPTVSALVRDLDSAIDKARKSIAADKQRDRDSAVMGYTILPVTKYDLKSIDNLDLVFRQVVALIERTTGRDMGQQKRALDDAALKEGRGALLDELKRL